MKKARAILCGVLAALMLAGCGGQQGGATMELKQYAVAQAAYPAYPKRPVEADYYRDDGQWDDSAYEADYEKYVDGLRALGKDDERVDTAALTAFSGNTAAAIFTTQENTVYSPVSLYVALSMLAELTDGETKRQVMDLLGVTDSGALREWTKTLWEQLYCDDGVNTLRLANAAFLNEAVQFRQPALDTLAESFYASSYRVPMGTTAANDTIGAWINEQTGGLLSEQASGLKMDPGTILALATTVYFRAKWDYEFAESNTTEDTFHSDVGDVKCNFMHASSDDTYYWSDHFSAVAKGLENSGAMWFLLPDESITPEKLLSEDETLDFLLSGGESAESDRYIVNLSIPKFDISSDKRLLEDLKAVGISDVFNVEKADFSPMTDDSEVALTQAQHAARVAIDEEGVTAAAYTVMQVSGAAAPPDQKVDFTLDRPFVFAITGEDGLPLFVGVVHKP